MINATVQIFKKENGVLKNSTFSFLKYVDIHALEELVELEKNSLINFPKECLEKKLQELIKDDKISHYSLSLFPLKNKVKISVFFEDHQTDFTTYDLRKPEEIEIFTNFIEITFEKWLTSSKEDKYKILEKIAWKFDEEDEKVISELDLEEYD